MARPGIVAHGLRSARSQTANAARPEGRSTRRISRAAASGSTISMIPHRHRTASTLAASRSIHSSSSWRNSTFEIPGGLRSLAGHSDHGLGAVAGDQDASGLDQLGGHEARVPGPCGELEHPLAGLQRQRVDHRHRDRHPPVTDPIGPLAPAGRRLLPHVAARRALLIGVARRHEAHPIGPASCPASEKTPEDGTDPRLSQSSSLGRP